MTDLTGFAAESQTLFKCCDPRVPLQRPKWENQENDIFGVKKCLFWGVPLSMRFRERQAPEATLKAMKGPMRECTTQQPHDERWAPEPACTYLKNLFGLFLTSRVAGCFPPYRARKSLRGRNPRKMGKNYKFPSPVRPPKMGKIGPQKGENFSEKYKICNFSVIFLHFRGSDRGGEFCNFSTFFGGFPPRRLCRPCKGEKQPATLGLFPFCKVIFGDPPKIAFKTSAKLTSLGLF